jgi:8-oxo-dGTP pyrophosphatase MutT (NUDIX family)
MVQADVSGREFHNRLGGPDMTADLPLYMRDPEAWRAHLIEGNARQARKRVSADLLVRDAAGGVLLVDPVYKPGWDLPGGMAEANEPPPDAARREVREELGLESQPRRMLCVDWVSPHGPWDDLLAFIFDGGTLGPDQISLLRPADGELQAFEFCTASQARERLSPRTWRRTAAALEAARSGQVRYLQDGYPL